MSTITDRAAPGAALLSLLAVNAVRAGELAVNLTRGALAVDGLSRFIDGAVVRGRAEFEHRWDAAIWWFAGATHRDEFARAPEIYAPQCGGRCAYAVSRGDTADIDARAWRIVDGRLYLNYWTRVRRLWEEDIPGTVRKGEADWPAVLHR